MSKIVFKKMEANTPGKDKRAQKTADSKSTVSPDTLKEAVMGRSKLSVKKPNKKRDVYLS